MNVQLAALAESDVRTSAVYDILAIKARELPVDSEARRAIERQMQLVIIQEHKNALAMAEAGAAAALAQVQTAERSDLANLGYKEFAGQTYGMTLAYCRKCEYEDLKAAYYRACMDVELARKALADWSA